MTDDYRSIARDYRTHMFDPTDELRERFNALSVAHTKLLASQPAWHRRPTGPGRWLCFEGNHVVAMEWRTEASFAWWLDRVIISGTCLYLGPIPDPPEELL